MIKNGKELFGAQHEDLEWLFSSGLLMDRVEIQTTLNNNCYVFNQEEIRKFMINYKKIRDIALKKKK